jgi:hypothetical protein
MNAVLRSILYIFCLSVLLFTVCCAGPTGRLADKLKGLDNDGLVAPGTILNSGDVTINMQVGLH